MRAARIIVAWLGVVVIGILVAAVALFALVQTTPGKRMLADFASRLASRDGLTVEISDITGFVPTDLRIGEIKVADANGQFVTVGGTELVWHPLSLLRGTVAVERLSAERLALDRLPVLPPADPAAAASSGSIPAFRVLLGKLAIEDIILGEPVTGMAARLSLDASARLVDLAEGLDLDFTLARLDSPGTLRGSVGYAAGEGHGRLALDITASEPAGGLAARLGRIEGLPPLALTIKGDAPLDNWNGTLALDAGPSGQISGTAAVRTIADGRRVMLDLGGTIDGLLPASVRPIFAGHTALIGSAVIADDFKANIEGLNLTSAGFGLALLGTVDPANETADVTFDLVGGDASHFASLVPGISWSGWRLNAHLAGPFGLPAVDATLTAQDLAGRGYGARSLNLTAKGTPADSALALLVDGAAEGLTSDQPKVAAALGKSARFSASASVSSGAQTLTAAMIQLTPLELSFVGSATPQSVKGNFKLPRLDLAAFAALTNRPLSGTVALAGDIDSGKDFSAVALNIDGTAKDVRAGIDAVDGFLAGTSRFKGALARAADGSIAVRNVTVAANGLDLAVDGGIAASTADLTATLDLADLGRLDPRVKGGAKAELRFSGGLDALALDGRINIASAEAMGKPIRDLAITVDFVDLTGLPSGQASLAGRIADRPAKGSVRFATEESRRRIDDLNLQVGSVSATGAASLATDNIVTGRFTVAARDLTDLAPLILTEIGGSLDGTVVLDAANGVQRVAVTGKAENVRFAGNRLEVADVDLRVVDPAGTPVLDGRATLSGLVAGSQRIDRATLTARSSGQATDVTLDTAVLGATLAARANIAPAGAATRIRLDQLRMARGPTVVTLSAPATITLAGSDGVAIDRLQLATGGGGATISGRVGQTMDLTADLRNLPLSLAALVAPALDPSGTLSGTARITGSATAPAGNYDFRVARLSTADLATKGIGPFDIAARGTLGGGRVNVDATVSAPSVSGLTVRGSVPIADGQLDLRIAGAIDLGIANTFLADQGSTLRGRANVDLTLRGTSAAPSAAGTIRVAGATFTDSVNGVTLTNIQAVLTGSNSQIVVSQLTAATPRGGSVSGSGTIGLDPARGFPANIRIDLSRANVISSDLLQLVASGRITIDGPVATRPRIAGQVDVIRLDINIADTPPGGLDPLQVRHINTGGKKQTARKGLRAQAETRAAAIAERTARRNAAPPAFVADLDLTIAARNAVFVRGMGIDAEFGGNLTLRGTTANMVTLGGFELRRGRFDLLGRRLDFTEGKVTFEGNTDPALDFTASTSTSDVTASIVVTGTASAPQVSFTSTPTMAQDEVLSRILFGRSISTLNASQALQVAQAVAQFSGGGPGVLDQVRRSLGVDSFDVDTTGQVGIGKRLNDRVYVGARQGPNANSGKVTVDVDVTRNIRLQGAAGGNGTGELGIGAQWDY